MTQFVLASEVWGEAEQEFGRPSETLPNLMGC